jgi:hypothetical protein
MTKALPAQLLLGTSQRLIQIKRSPYAERVNPYTPPGTTFSAFFLGWTRRVVTTSSGVSCAT